MRNRSPLAFAGVLIILLLSVMGFAAFSATPVETAQTPEGVVLPPTASGRIAGSVLGAQLATSVTPVPTEAPAAEDAPTLQVDSLVDADEQTTTTEATTTTAAPATTTTVPPTTTTAPPTTTTAPPDTTVPPPAADHPAAVEQWRGLVSAYWPASLVEEALSVIDCESNGDPNAVNPSSGASGLFQFLPSTWASAAPQAGWAGADVFDPGANVATAYWLYSQFTEPWQQWSCKP
ncbi:MAG TPA: transglycosylase SLT domain-containing protein [Acidimicrobiia bacterium]|nr:transglycosylase SLT domain-containing protein [Acidimicrobiia bacterium]